MRDEALLDLLQLLLLTRQLQIFQRSRYNPLHECFALILILDRCVLDGAYRSGIVNQHLFRLVLVRLYPVCDHVDGNVSACTVPGHFDV